MRSMTYRTQEYLETVRKAIISYQMEHLLSDRELSVEAGLSPSMISKIKAGKTLPKLSTLRKLKNMGVAIPRPPDPLMTYLKANENEHTTTEVEREAAA